MENEHEQELILGRYKLLETLGEGGSGTVELCWDSRIQRRVAIKRIPLQDAGPLSGGGIPGLAEARTAALLKHPAIVDLIDFETQETEAFLIMEAIEGPSLSEIIDTTEPGTLDLDIIATITEAMASALDFAHENGVLHLDVKPDNVLIDMSGRPKVSDFGIAELADAQGFGQACGGTIGYMPPEQMCQKDLDQRCDLFALAACVYEMLTGDNPFFADSINASLRKVEEFEVEAPSEFRDDIDPEIDDIIFAALEPDRENRIDTIAEFMAEIKPYLGNPKHGQKKLHDILNEVEEEEEAPQKPKHQRHGIWTHFSDRVLFAFGRGCSALLIWWIAIISLIACGYLELPFALLGALAPALLGAFFPSLGSLIALLGFSAVCFYLPNTPDYLGIIIIATSIPWWFFIARRSTTAVNCTLIGAPLALIYGVPFVPMLSGLFLRPLKAMGATAMSGILVLVLGIATGSDCIYHVNPFITPDAHVENLVFMLWSQPSTWISLLSWIVASGVMSAICAAGHSANRFVCILGAFVCAIITFATQLLIQYWQVGAFAFPDTAWCIAQVLSLVVIVIICVLGIPQHNREE